MEKWSHSWKSSKKPSKQRKYRANAPSSIRRKLLCSPLSKALIKKYSRRSIPLRKGDTVKIMRGEMKGKTGKVNKLNLQRYKVYLEGVNQIRKDGNQNPKPFEASNLLVTSLNLDDHKRSDILKRKKISETKNG